MAEVRIEAVSKTYGSGVVAVRDVSLTVQDREFVVLVGPSGCGKSTLLRMVAGLEDITSGTISIDGQRVNDMAPRKRDVAMVFQNYALYPHMNVFENMALSLRIRKEKREVIESRVRETATMLGIDGLLERRPSQLSGGQRQRVALGRAIVRRPKVFLFDEPLSNLDAKMRVETRTEISRLHRELQATMIYVTHDQTEAMTMGSRIVVLKDGEVQQIASPLELYDRPANRFVASFLGSPPMNFWPARLAADAQRLQVASQDLILQGAIPESLRGLAQRDLVIGLRPEDLRLAGGNEGLEATLKVTVDVVEPLGSETLLYFGTDGHRGVARVAPTEAVEVGHSIDLRADLRRAHFFDPSSGHTVLSRPGL